LFRTTRLVVGSVRGEAGFFIHGARRPQYDEAMRCIWLACCCLFALPAIAEDWPRWRGPAGNAVSHETGLPTEWSATKNIAWRTELPGEGSSSSIVCGQQIFLTAAFDSGTRRALLCLDRDSGQIIWTREVTDDNPEVSSALTGHAAPTPVCDGRRVVAVFGNAGVICCSVTGEQLWQRDFGEFESELGLASSPIIIGDRVLLLCDHDGDRFRSFDSFLIALSLTTGETVWKTDRRDLYRSWSTPILVPTTDGRDELIINAQDHLRAYDPTNGEELWRVAGMTGWVTPSPVFARGLIFAASGRDGPTMAVRPGGRGDVTETHLVWIVRQGAPYICSPIAYGEQLYVLNDQGVLSCYHATTGELAYRQRLAGKFIASPVAADGKVYFTNEAGVSYVIRSGGMFELLAKNDLAETILASPAIADGSIFLRTSKALYRVSER
jgi:outer membrane protein assembly factor BamB